MIVKPKKDITTISVERKTARKFKLLAVSTGLSLCEYMNIVAAEMEKMNGKK